MPACANIFIACVRSCDALTNYITKWDLVVFLLIMKLFHIIIKLHF